MILSPRELEVARLVADDCRIPRMGNAYSYLYAIRRLDTREVKIGISMDPAQRLKELQGAHGERLTMSFAVPCTHLMEDAAHRRFALLRKLREWFNESPDLLAWIAEQQDVSSRIPPRAPHDYGPSATHHQRSYREHSEVLV